MIGRTIKLAINIIAFQITWFACVLGAVHGWPLLGVAAAIITIALHLFFSNNRASELKLIVFAITLGLVLESLLIYSGLTSFVGQPPGGPPLPPLWLLAMWAAFATLPNGCLSWLQTRPALAALLGLVGGPLAYLGGERLGGITILEPRLFAISAIAVVWAIATVLLIKAAAYGRDASEI